MDDTTRSDPVTAGHAGPTAGPGSGAASGAARRAVQVAAFAGCAHALLFLFAYWLVSTTPTSQASDEDIVKFYEGSDRRRLIVVGLYVMPFAGIAFLWFSVAMRSAIRAGSERTSELLAGMQVASGILYVAMFFVAAAAISVMAAQMEIVHSKLDPVIVRGLPQYGRALLIVFAMRMAAIFVFTTSRLGNSTGVLPRWFVWLGWAVGLFLLLSAGFSRALVLVFPFWLLALCAVLLARLRRLPRTAAAA